MLPSIFECYLILMMEYFGFQGLANSFVKLELVSGIHMELESELVKFRQSSCVLTVILEALNKK